MAKYLVNEIRRVFYTIEVPDGITRGDILAAKLDSAQLQSGGDGIPCIAECSQVDSYTVEVAVDDDEPAMVQFDQKMRDRWPPEASWGHATPTDLPR